MNTYTVFEIAGIKNALLSGCYAGYLGAHNKPEYPAYSYVMQSMTAVIHFHYCLN